MVAEGGVEELDGVDYRHGMTDFGEGGLELEETAGIAGDDDVGLEVGDEAGFAFAELGGGFRLNEIVDARGTTADGGFGNFQKLNAGDLGKELARLHVNTLRVLQVAGIVKSYASRKRMAFGTGWQFGKNFTDVATFVSEAFGAIGVDGIVAKKMAVVLHVGAATGSIDDDGVDVGLFKGADGAASQFQCRGFLASVNAQGTAASLLGRGDHFAAFSCQNADGGRIDV